MSSFNPKPEAMAGSETDRPHVAPAVASGLGLNGLATRIPTFSVGVRSVRIVE